MKVLVVHRQKEVIEHIKSVLQNNESIIRFSDSGLDGLLAARIETFDLIICSTDLPVITGFELARSLRTNSVNKTTPIIFLSDQLDDKFVQLGQTLGVAAMFAESEMDQKLLDIVNDVRASPSTKWENYLSNERLN